MKMVSCTVLLLLVYISTLKITEARYYGSDESPEQYGYTNYDRSSEEGYGGLSIKDDVDDVSLELVWLQPKSTGKTPCDSARKQNRRYKRMQANNIDCTWNQGTNILPAYPPIILRTCSNKIVLPVHRANNNNIMRVQHGTVVSMSCPGTVKHSINNNGNTPNYFTSLPGVKDIRARCNNGILTNVQGNTVLQMNAMGCKGPVQEEIRFLQAGNQVQLMAIGFWSINSTNDNYFYQQIKFLLDNNHETTLWTDHTLHGANLPAKERFARPLWKEGSKSFSSPDLNEEAYGIPSQKNRFTTLIQFPGDKYFARGHLAPAADFVTKAEFDATFQFVNALPQWQQINNGNWGMIEQNIRDYAVNHATDLRIITGGYGNLKDSNGNNMYLGGLLSNSMEWPIPGATWKIVIKEGLLNAGVKEGVAFVVSNDPFTTNPPVIPNTITCSSLTWLGTLSPHKEKGHTYCFSLVNFKQTFNTIPYIDELLSKADVNTALLN